MSMGNVALCFLENHYYSTKDAQTHTHIHIQILKMILSKNFNKLGHIMTKMLMMCDRV